MHTPLYGKIKERRETRGDWWIGAVMRVGARLCSLVGSGKYVMSYLVVSNLAIVN